MADEEFNRADYAGVAANLAALLDSSANERAVQTFLKRYRYIVRNALNVHAWNSVHMQPEFSLGRDYVVDFLILSEDSGGWHTVLIELESPKKRPFNKKGSPSKALAMGLAQLDEWEIWIGKNEPLFRERLSSIAEDATIRDPRTVIDKKYIVVVGRRCFFRDSDVQGRRGLYRSRDREIVSYDRLLDMAKGLDPALKASPVRKPQRQK